MNRVVIQQLVYIENEKKKKKLISIKVLCFQICGKREMLKISNKVLMKIEFYLAFKVRNQWRNY